MNASISRRESHCYVAVDRAMSKRDEVNPEGHPRVNRRESEQMKAAFVLSNFNRTSHGPIEQLRIHVSRDCLKIRFVISACLHSEIPCLAFGIFNFPSIQFYPTAQRR